MRNVCVFFCLAACALPLFAGKAFIQPKAGPADADGWESYDTPYVLTQQGAKDVSPGLVSPEAAVVHFFAGLMRKDACYKQALPSPVPQDVQETLQEYASWTFTKIVLLKRKQCEPGTYWILLDMAIDIQGKQETGQDEITVTERDGKWYVVEPPC